VSSTCWIQKRLTLGLCADIWTLECARPYSFWNTFYLKSIFPIRDGFSLTKGLFSKVRVFYLSNYKDGSLSTFKLFLGTFGGLILREGSFCSVWELLTEIIFWCNWVSVSSISFCKVLLWNINLSITLYEFVGVDISSFYKFSTIRVISLMLEWLFNCRGAMRGVYNNKYNT
jgi:hypothetical protein